jgi:hypothetical protein
VEDHAISLRPRHGLLLATWHFEFVSRRRAGGQESSGRRVQMR